MAQGGKIGSMEWRVAGAGLFFLFIFLSGIWLSRSGKPLNGIILTMHKLVSLAAGVYLIITLYQMNRAAALGAMELAAAVVTGLCFLGVVVFGGLLSTGKAMPARILRIHQAMSIVTVLATTAMLVLLLTGQ
jgi:glucan phosphoethanolaminetransferase (alkaline phosphatase superfamily)